MARIERLGAVECLQCPVELVQRHQGLAEIGMCDVVDRRQRDGAFAVGQRLRIAAGFTINNGTQSERPGRIRIELQCAVNRRQCFGQAAQGEQRGTAADMRLRLVRIEG